MWTTKNFVHRIGLSELKRGRRFARDMCVEFVSTFCMMAAACFVINSGADTIRSSFASGFIVTSIIWAAGSTTGGIINPATTISAVVVGTIRPFRALCYIIAQCAGSYVSVLVVAGVMLPPSDSSGVTDNPYLMVVTKLHPALSPWQGILIEAFLTFVLAFVVYATVDPSRPDLHGSGPLAVGLAVITTNLCGTKYTGASTNPARSFGPALASGDWRNQWVYWVGPMLGAVVGGLLYEYAIRETILERAIADQQEIESEIDKEDANNIKSIDFTENVYEVSSVSVTDESSRKISYPIPEITIRRTSNLSDLSKRLSVAESVRKMSGLSVGESCQHRKMSLPRNQPALHQVIASLQAPDLSIRKMSLPAYDI